MVYLIDAESVLCFILYVGMLLRYYMCHTELYGIFLAWYVETQYDYCIHSIT